MKLLDPMKLRANAALLSGLFAISYGGLVFCHADTTHPPSASPATNQYDSMKIRIRIGLEEVTATIADTEAGRDFISMLPLTLRLADHAGAEKISDLPRKLDTKGSPAGYAPSTGDIAFYAPWGNLALFYKDAVYANGLVHLGKIQGDLAKISRQKTDFDVTLEIIK